MLFAMVGNSRQWSVALIMLILCPLFTQVVIEVAFPSRLWVQFIAPFVEGPILLGSPTRATRSSNPFCSHRADLLLLFAQVAADGLPGPSARLWVQLIAPFVEGLMPFAKVSNSKQWSVALIVLIFCPLFAQMATEACPGRRGAQFIAPFVDSLALSRLRRGRLAAMVCCSWC